MDAAAELPTLVIGGYLGAGKTTLVNHLLRHAGGRRIAVLVNDFGSVDLDAALIEDAAAAGSSGVISLAGGCLCCSFGDDLVGTLMALGRRRPPPDVVLIELSGVALPAAVVAAAHLAPGVQVQGTLCLADAAELRRQAADRYVGATVMQQLHDADWVLLNKPDLVDAATLAQTRQWLQNQLPQVRVLACAAAELPPELVLGWRAEVGASAPPPAEAQAARFAARPIAPAAARFAARPIAPAAARFAARPIAPAAGHHIFASLTLPLAAGVDLEALARQLAQPGLGVLRAKGIGQDANGAPQLLQLAGTRWSLSPAPAGAAGGQLVLIGLRERLDLPALRALIEPATRPPAAARY